MLNKEEQLDFKQRQELQIRSAKKIKQNVHDNQQSDEENQAQEGNDSIKLREKGSQSSNDDVDKCSQESYDEIIPRQQAVYEARRDQLLIKNTIPLADLKDLRVQKGLRRQQELEQLAQYADSDSNRSVDFKSKQDNQKNEKKYKHDKGWEAAKGRQNQNNQLSDFSENVKQFPQSSRKQQGKEQDQRQLTYSPSLQKGTQQQLHDSMNGSKNNIDFSDRRQQGQQQKQYQQKQQQDQEQQEQLLSLTQSPSPQQQQKLMDQLKKQQQLQLQRRRQQQKQRQRLQQLQQKQHNHQQQQKLALSNPDHAIHKQQQQRGAHQPRQFSLSSLLHPSKPQFSTTSLASPTSPTPQNHQYEDKLASTQQQLLESIEKSQQLRQDLLDSARNNIQTIFNLDITGDLCLHDQLRKVTSQLRTLDTSVRRQISNLQAKVDDVARTEQKLIGSGAGGNIIIKVGSGDVEESPVEFGRQTQYQKNQADRNINIFLAQKKSANSSKGQEKYENQYNNRNTEPFYHKQQVRPSSSAQQIEEKMQYQHEKFINNFSALKKELEQSMHQQFKKLQTQLQGNKSVPHFAGYEPMVRIHQEPALKFSKKNSSRFQDEQDEESTDDSRGSINVIYLQRLREMEAQINQARSNAQKLQMEKLILEKQVASLSQMLHIQVGKASKTQGGLEFKSSQRISTKPEQKFVSKLDFRKKHANIGQTSLFLKTKDAHFNNVSKAPFGMIHSSKSMEQEPVRIHHNSFHHNQPQNQLQKEIQKINQKTDHYELLIKQKDLRIRELQNSIMDYIERKDASSMPKVNCKHIVDPDSRNLRQIAAEVRSRSNSNNSGDTSLSRLQRTKQNDTVVCSSHSSSYSDMDVQRLKAKIKNLKTVYKELSKENQQLKAHLYSITQNGSYPCKSNSNSGTVMDTTQEKDSIVSKSLCTSEGVPTFQKSKGMDGEIRIKEKEKTESYLQYQPQYAHFQPEQEPLNHNKPFQRINSDLNHDDEWFEQQKQPSSLIKDVTNLT